MRQWMVNTAYMCKDHLLGEHFEHHLFRGTLNRHKSVNGFLTGNCLEPHSLHKRHDELAAEMKRRGYNHKSPLEDIDISYLTPEQQNIRVDKEASLKELLRRCPQCAIRYQNMKVTEIQP